MSTTTSTNATPLAHSPSQPKVSPKCTSNHASEYSQMSYDPYLRHDITTERELPVEDFVKAILGCGTWADLVESENVKKMSDDATFKSLLQDYIDSVSEADRFPRFTALANHIVKTENDNQTNRIRFVPVPAASASNKPPVIISHATAVDSHTPSGDCGVKKSPFRWTEVLGYVNFKLEADEDEWVTVSEYSSHSTSSRGSRSSSNTKSQSSSGSSQSSSKNNSQSLSNGRQTSSLSNKRSRSEEWSESASKRCRRRAYNVEAKLRCASHALEMLSNGGLRTHALGLYIDKHNLSLQYFDRSMFVSSISFAFNENPCLLVALLFALNDQQWGITPGFDRSSMILTLNGGWKLQLSNTLSQQRVIIGRGTVVFRGSATEAPNVGQNKALAIKISSPTCNRRSERDILQLAYDKATGRFQKMLDHLPAIRHWEDIGLGESSPQERLASFFKQGEYEQRALRVIAFRELRPIQELVTADELSIALRDIFHCYRWLYEEVKILHRDISLYNVMYYRMDGKVFGVLNDFDLAILLGDNSSSSKQRTGTKPYMAYELLLRDNIPHLYRHDLESLFYVILILATHFANGKQIAEPPFRNWFSLDSITLAEAKCCILGMYGPPLPALTPPYAAFEKWIHPMQLMFKKGIIDGKMMDDETLGGNITFDNMAAIFSIELSSDVTKS